jgi:hypothetical protein
MMEKPLANAPRRGRPTKQEAIQRRVNAAGIDPALVDPKRILAGIAVDKKAPASARVAAARALLAASGGSADDLPDHSHGLDELSRRALQLIAESGRPN